MDERKFQETLYNAQESALIQTRETMASIYPKGLPVSVENAVKAQVEAELRKILGDVQVAQASVQEVAQPLPSAPIKPALPIGNADLEKAQARVNSMGQRLVLFTFGHTREAGSRSDMSWDAGALVTAHQDGSGKTVYRVWDTSGKAALYRKVSGKWAHDSANVVHVGESPANGNVSIAPAPPAHVAPAPPAAPVTSGEGIIQGIPAHVTPGMPVTYMSNGTPRVLVSLPNGRTRSIIVSPSNVQNGVYVGPPQSVTGTHFDKGLRRQLDRHNKSMRALAKGEPLPQQERCTCTPLFACPAVRRLGKAPTQVGAITYIPGPYAVSLVITPGSTLEAKIRKEGGADAWGLS